MKTVMPVGKIDCMIEPMSVKSLLPGKIISKRKGKGINALLSDSFLEHRFAVFSKEGAGCPEFH